MGKLFNTRADSSSIPISYLIEFLRLNFNMEPSDLMALDGKKIPENNEEFTFRVINSDGLYYLALEFSETVYEESLPESLFNYFVWWVKKYEEVKYGTKEEIDIEFRKRHLLGLGFNHDKKDSEKLGNNS
jgi:hypothetical protein